MGKKDKKEKTNGGLSITGFSGMTRVIWYILADFGFGLWWCMNHEGVRLW